MSKPAYSIKLLSYNMQVAMGSTRPHHYLTHSWKHILPHSKIHRNLDRIANIITDYDIVALQEADAGSVRSAFTNHTEYLAAKGHFKYWYYQVNRNIGKLARHSNSLLSRYRPNAVQNHKLPGLIPGRGMLLASYGQEPDELGVCVLHLALSRRARIRQLEMAAELVTCYKHAIFMGDMNCEPDSVEMAILAKNTSLVIPDEETCTFPSWKPKKRIDHILLTPALKITESRVLEHYGSDHLPVAMTIQLPTKIKLVH